MTAEKSYAAQLAKLIAAELSNAKPRPRVLGVRAAAEYCGISDESLRKLAKAGRLPVVKIDNHARFDLRDLDLFIETHKG